MSITSSVVGFRHSINDGARSDSVLASKYKSLTKASRKYRHNNPVINVLVNITVVSSGVYSLALSHVPELAAVTSMLLAGGVIGVVFLVTLIRPGLLVTRTLLVFYMFLCTGLWTLAGEAVNWEAQFRYVVSILALTFLIGLPIPDKRRLLGYISAFVIANASLVAVNGGFVTYAGTLRITPFFGDDSAVHSSALVVLAAALTIWFVPWKRHYQVFWIMLAISLLVGYGTASEMVMLAVFVSAHILRRLKIRRLWLVPFLVLAIAGALVYRNINSLEGAKIQELGVDAAGSGRLGTWVQRVNIFGNSDLLTKAIGSGPYTDYRISDVWWWEPKSAHNDWITMLMEFGVIGIILLAIYFLAISCHVPFSGKHVLIAVALGMMLTNSALDRPSVTIMWGIALYCAQYNLQRGRSAVPRAIAKRPEGVSLS